MNLFAAYFNYYNTYKVINFLIAFYIFNNMHHISTSCCAAATTQPYVL